MVDDTISRQAAIDALTDENIIEHLDSVYDSELHRFKRATQRIIAQLPSAQPEWKTAKWIDDDGQEVKHGLCANCSACGEWSEYLTDFCPNCGAYMRKWQ